MPLFVGLREYNSEEKNNIPFLYMWFCNVMFIALRRHVVGIQSSVIDVRFYTTS